MRLSLPRPRTTSGKEQTLIRQAAVVALSVVPFVASSVLAFFTWELVEPLATLWRMIVIFFVWIGAFAVSTQFFWKVTGLLATEA
jgi:hypothetical protein